MQKSLCLKKFLEKCPKECCFFLLKVLLIILGSDVPENTT